VLHQRQGHARQEMKDAGDRGHGVFNDFDKSTRIQIVAELKNYLQGDNTLRCIG
jgi:hypothetical protein